MAFLKVSKLVSILLEIDFWIIIIAERPKRYLERKVATDRKHDRWAISVFVINYILDYMLWIRCLELYALDCTLDGFHSPSQSTSSAFRSKYAPDIIKQFGQESDRQTVRLKLRGILIFYCFYHYHLGQIRILEERRM